MKLIPITVSILSSWVLYSCMVCPLYPPFHNPGGHHYDGPVTAEPAIQDKDSNCIDPSVAAQEQGPLSLELIHRDQVIPVTPGKEITLHDRRFALLFNMAAYNRYCQRQVAASAMASPDIDSMENAIHPPMVLTDTSPFGWARAMAPELSLRYDILYLTEQAHHYLIFEPGNDPRMQRLSIQESVAPGIYRYRWDIFEIAKVNLEGVETIPPKSEIHFAMIFFRDSNLDSIIETGEFLLFYVHVVPDDG
ncbi:MAG: hypothetical protein KDK33_10005 [Leptospiraceae bacterium]|nr:hypothetical protein [Leptospiraceae bacterium]